MDESLTYSDWESCAPEAMRQDPLWRMAAYRLSAYIADVASADARLLARVPACVAVAEQLARAAGSVGANVAEGYSRGAGRDRARFFEYALGSARETLHWYCMVAADLPSSTLATERIDVLTQIRRLLLTIIPEERKRSITRVRDQ